ncbi:MAG: hypothetical protein SX243_04970 [Acidobacteriota bacterium]|nr:hypothetical protein [Acidobacteriota bacterium]
MKIRDQDLRDLAGDAPSPGECPQPEAWVRLAAEEITGKEREELLLHLESCADCSAEMRVALSLRRLTEGLESEVAAAESPEEASASEPPEASEVPDPYGSREPLRPATPMPPRGVRAPRRWWPQLAAAAVVVLMAVGGLQLWRVNTGDVDPGPPGGERLREATGAVTPAPGSVLEQAPSTLSWPPEVGATAYRVTLFASDAEPLWTSEAVAVSEISLPAAVQERLEAGGAYFWIVEVEGSVRRGRLGPYELSLEP